MFRSQLLSVLVSFPLLLAATGPLLCAQTETAKFRLHKFEQPIGSETYTITRTGDALHLESQFSFTDRGTTVPLTAKFDAAADYTARSFTISGSTSRVSTIDDAVAVSGRNANVRNGKISKSKIADPVFFTIEGYAPAAMQQSLLRYWLLHGKPSHLSTLPSGSVSIEDRGPQTVEIDGQPMHLERYNVSGLVWGLETLWIDAQNRLAALVTRDAEFDHFEAVREEYEPGLSQFVAAAATDQMSQLSQLSKSFPGRKTGVLAVTGATLIDGTGRPPVQNATIVTREGKILAAGPSASVQIPPDAQRIDAGGKFIIPGLWDMHAHYEQVEWGPIYLAAGVTTVRDVGNEFEFITNVRNQVNSGAGLGPHMLLAGVVDGDGPIALGVDRVNSPEDAARWVHKYHHAGFQQMKIYSSVTSANVKAICDQAHALGMTVTGHIPEGMTVYDGVNDGMDQVNHITFLTAALTPKGFNWQKATPEERLKALQAGKSDSPEGKRLIEFLKAHGTVIDDTAAIWELFWRTVDQQPVAVEPGLAFVAPELKEQLTEGGSPVAMKAVNHARRANMLALMGALHRAGVPLIAGTDQGVPGFSVYREIELYAEAGFTPLEALQAATVVPARVMKLDGERGTVEVGKSADFDILDGNPLFDIHNVRTVRRVVANGVLFDCAPLWTSVGFTPPAAAR
jgi:imidazolonepropionase-like amidohydrolase